jgi:hypothetical protein
MPSISGIVSSASTYVHPKLVITGDTFNGPADVQSYQSNGWQYALITVGSGNYASIETVVPGVVQLIAIGGGGGGAANFG